ncbi:hypothetical protein MKX03_015841, partial [Papaver bracteatum]
CVSYLEEIEDVARKCYSEPIDLRKDEFVKMMFIDGMFMIELFRRHEFDADKIKQDDPFLGNISNLPSLVRDLILLENQLPMVVLDGLFNLLALKEELKGVPINILALRFFNHLMPRDKKVTQTLFSDYQGKHLLDLFSKTFHRLLPKKMKYLCESIPSVTELKRVGVKFVAGSSNGSFLDIKFKNGIMEIPPIKIEDQTDALFRNCIAFEQYCDGNLTYMTSYAHFMDSLINSGEDVRVLCKQGILKHSLDHDEDVATLFNKLCCEVTVANFYYSELCDLVNNYYNTRWHAWKATLKRDYFNSPWEIISLVGAIILIIFTLTATVFSILSFTIHKSSAIILIILTLTATVFAILSFTIHKSSNSVRIRASNLKLIGNK